MGPNRISDAELDADMYRYRNNKEGSIYLALLELKQRRAGLFSFKTADGKEWEEVGAPLPTNDKTVEGSP